MSRQQKEFEEFKELQEFKNATDQHLLYGTIPTPLHSRSHAEPGCCRLRSRTSPSLNSCNSFLCDFLKNITNMTPLFPSLA